MKRPKLAMLLAAAVTMAAFAGVADGPKLVREKPVFKPGEKGPHGDAVESFGPARLSPDGRHLLYGRRQKDPPRPAGHEGHWPNRLYRPVLRDLTSGKETLLPGPAWTSDDPLVMMLARRVFSADGKTIVLAAPIDTNDNGIHDRRAGEKIQPMLYDIATGKARRLEITGEFVLPMFDRKGKDLLVLSWRKADRSGKLYSTPADKLQLKELYIGGVSLPACPTADVVPLWLLPNRKSGKKQRLVLYDIKAGEQVAELPIHESNTSLDDRTPQWTADGRYFYYVDYEVSGDGNQKQIARVYDRRAKKETALLDGAVPVGPGPAPTTMVLMTRDRALALHDAAAGKTWTLTEDAVRARCAVAGRLVYMKRDGTATRPVVAEIAMPATRAATKARP